MPAESGRTRPRDPRRFTRACRAPMLSNPDCRQARSPDHPDNNPALVPRRQTGIDGFATDDLYAAESLIREEITNRHRPCGGKTDVRIESWVRAEDRH